MAKHVPPVLPDSSMQCDLYAQGCCSNKYPPIFLLDASYNITGSTLEIFKLANTTCHVDDKLEQLQSNFFHLLFR